MKSANPSEESKVVRTLQKYDMEEFGDWLEAAWHGEGAERHSLRELKDEFNKRVLEEHLHKAGETPISAEVDTIYEVLTGEDVTKAERVQKRRELAQAGIDFEDVQREFVTHQTIHNYLTDIRGTDYKEASYEDQLERNIETLQRLQSRMNTITEDTIDRMCDADREVGEKYNILVGVQVVCQFCGERYPAVELVRQGGCPCDQ